MGDIIYFEVENNKDGKTQAVNCRIHGVKTRATSKLSKSHNKSGLALIFQMGVFMVVAYLIYANFFTSLSTASPVGSSSEFACEGKQTCTQMQSCAEATFYLQHCPNTKIDGDNDGIPCEWQHCQ